MEAATASASISSSSVVRVVPTVPGMRTRKRGDDDSCSTENDSMRPLADPRRTKRARRTILDAFSSISLKKQRNGGSTPGDGGAEDQLLLDEDADSSRAVAEDDGGYTTNSSLEEEDGVTDDCDDDEPMLSDKEAIKKDVERKVMLELVFGPDSSFVPPKNPVDRKLDRLIRTSLKKASTTGDLPLETQDDMSLTISSDSDLSGISGGLLKRSNSLPEIYSQMDTVSEEMETDLE